MCYRHLQIIVKIVAFQLLSISSIHHPVAAAAFPHPASSCSARALASSCYNFAFQVIQAAAIQLQCLLVLIQPFRIRISPRPVIQQFKCLRIHSTSHPAKTMPLCFASSSHRVPAVPTQSTTQQHYLLFWRTSSSHQAMVIMPSRLAIQHQHPAGMYHHPAHFQPFRIH